MIEKLIVPVVIKINANGFYILVDKFLDFGNFFLLSNFDWMF
jgi:hypothetical protein